MAGIGFALRRAFNEGPFLGPLKAFTYAALISSGPWLASSLAISLLGAFTLLGANSPSHRVFLAIVSTSFTFSLIGVGPVQLVASRFMADRLYEKSLDQIVPAFWQLLIPTLLVQLIAACTFLSFVPLPRVVKLVALVLYLTINGTWVALVILSAAQAYRTIGGAIALGLLMSLAGALVGGHYGLLGQLTGFTLGYVYLFLRLLLLMESAFGPPRALSAIVWTEVRRYWLLALIGFTYNLGLWADKLMFWWHPVTGWAIAGPLRAAPVYDNPMFIAYLSTVPGFALFLFKVETDFNERYRAYFETIAAQRSLPAILRAKDKLVATLRQGFGWVLKIQGTLTLLLVAFAPELSRTWGLAWFSLPVFRAGLLAAFLQLLHAIVLLLLLYFDWRWRAAGMALVFLGTNVLATTLAFSGGIPAYGLGCTIASAVTLVVGLVLLERGLAELEFFVFMSQPLPAPGEAPAAPSAGRWLWAQRFNRWLPASSPTSLNSLPEEQ